MHVHTCRSDGSAKVTDAVDFARMAGLSGIAITDHDTMDALQLVGEYAQSFNFDLIPGVELSSIDNKTGRRAHILVYFPKDISHLTPLFNFMAQNRRKNAEKIFSVLSKQYPITWDMVEEQAKNSSTIFKVHFMRLLMERGYTNSAYGELYSELFGGSEGTKFKTEYPEVHDVCRAAKQSGGAVFLAHPCVYASYDLAEELAKNGLIDGIESRYPRLLPEYKAWHEDLIKRYSLLCSAGTDFHGFYSSKPHHIGSCSASRAEIDSIKEFLNINRTR